MNLNVDVFRNGDVIQEAQTAAEWIAAGTNQQPAWCYYDNDPANGPLYGRLYNWYAVNDARGLAPVGYHIPTQSEMESYANEFNGGYYDSGVKGGFRFDDGNFNYVTMYGNWWSSTETDQYTAWNTHLGYDYSYGHLTNNNKAYGFSVKCIQDY